VTIEVTTWVTKLVGGDGSGSRVAEEPFAPGESLRDVLRRWSVRYPELDAALWDPSRTNLGEHIEVFVNDAVLGVAHELDSPLESGDRITLMGQFMGGQGEANGTSASLHTLPAREGTATGDC
jgi:hypothetical protein